VEVRLIIPRSAPPAQDYPEARCLLFHPIHKIPVAMEELPVFWVTGENPGKIQVEIRLCGKLSPIFSEFQERLRI